MYSENYVPNFFLIAWVLQNTFLYHFFPTLSLFSSYRKFSYTENTEIYLKVKGQGQQSSESTATVYHNTFP